MIIDIRKLNAQKKYSGSMEFEYPAPETLIEIPFVKFVGPVKIAFEYDLYEDDSLEIRGTVAYKLEGQCSRCLKAAEQDVEGELDAYFEPRRWYIRNPHNPYGTRNKRLNPLQLQRKRLLNIWNTVLPTDKTPFL